MLSRSNLYPGPPVSADLRFRKGRLRLEIDGSGPIKSARMNGKSVKPRPDGALVLPSEFTSGTVVIHTAGGGRK